MSLETRREKVIYLALVPVMAAVLGAFATALFQGMSGDHDQVVNVAQILRDATMTGEQKLRALEVYREITDRPWSVVRSLTGILAVSLGLFAFDISQRIRGK